MLLLFSHEDAVLLSLSCSQSGKHMLKQSSGTLQEIMAREQGMLMEELAHFVNVVEGRSELTGQDVQEWTMGQYMDHVFEVGYDDTHRLTAGNASSRPHILFIYSFVSLTS